MAVIKIAWIKSIEDITLFCFTNKCLIPESNNRQKNNEDENLSFFKF